LKPEIVLRLECDRWLVLVPQRRKNAGIRLNQLDRSLNRGDMNVEMATASPPLEPPGVNPKLNGLFGGRHRIARVIVHRHLCRVRFAENDRTCGLKAGDCGASALE
jgi:hypothetical protein